MLIAAGLVVVAAVAIAIFVAVSGDDEDATRTTSTPSTTAVELAEWREQVEAGCREWNERYSHLEGAEPDTAEQALEHTADVEALARGLAAVLDEAGRPESERGDAQQLVELTDQVVDEAGTLHEAADAGDGPAIDRATAELEELGKQINELAERLEVPACGGY
jgi:hypothetical protein